MRDLSNLWRSKITASQQEEPQAVKKFKSDMAKKRLASVNARKRILGPTADVEITLGNAKKAVVKTNDEFAEVGDEMYIDGKPAPDGTHIAAGEHEGKKFTTQNGKITKIEEPEEIEKMVQAAVRKGFAPLLAELKNL